MANIDKKGNNRYTNAASSEDAINQIDNNDIVLKILKDEFPDDHFFAQNTLGPGSADDQALEQDPSLALLPDASRNTKNVLTLSTERDEYTKYELAKTFPTADEDDLDDIIDEEWEYFEDLDDSPVVEISDVKASGLFLVASEMALRDVHDLYINNGPQTIETSDDDITNRVFCVFFVRNGVAYAIPTYKTLEVMLVERGETYDVIQEATAEQMKEFDLLIDGKGDEDNMSPLDEFRNRTYTVRDSDWSTETRFRSGYIPIAPFVRDPGDYIKPEGLRNTTGRDVVDEDGNTIEVDQYFEEDPGDRYFDQVFQKQTYKEKLREKFEGKMVIADWPAPYKNEEVNMDTEIVSDDAVLNLRMMINGHWKFVNDGSVMKLYAYLNDYNISSFIQGSGRYGTNGYIQLLIDAGGCTVVQAADGVSKQNDVLGGNSDIGLEVEPLWNAFPHIVDADDDGLKGVDRLEYQEYLDNFTNGGAPFDIEHLKPYEPAGSIQYYPKQQYQDLIAQSIQQGQIDVIKEQIYESWPQVASLVQNTKTQFDAAIRNTPTMSEYVTTKLGPEGPLYKIMLSKEGNWKFVKKKSNSLKVKDSHKRLFKLCSKKLRIKTSLNENEEETLVSKYKWMKTVHRDKFAAWASEGAADEVAAVAAAAAGPGVVLAGAISSAAALAASTAAAAAAAAATSAALAAAGFTISAGLAAGAPVVVVSTPSVGALLGSMLTNPITLIAGAAIGTFYLIDWAMGEVTADEYDLPPWRFMEEEEYLQSCIFNEIDSFVAGFKLAADAADTHMPYVSSLVNNTYDQMLLFDTALLQAQSVEEFSELHTYLLAIQDLCDDINDSGICASIISLRTEIDIYVADQLKRQYNAIQFLRKKVNRDTNSKKYGIVWPKGPQNILNEHVPGLTFDNHLPEVN